MTSFTEPHSFATKTSYSIRPIFKNKQIRLDQRRQIMVSGHFGTAKGSLRKSCKIATLAGFIKKN